jgi:hypothetical protein
MQAIIGFLLFASLALAGCAHDTAAYHYTPAPPPSYLK